MESGLYIHIPFCSHHCGYCGFAVSARHVEDQPFHDRYIAAILRELQLQLRRFPDLQFSTLYMGGGTPSQLGIPEIEKLFRGIAAHIPFAALREITFECNPEDIHRTPSLIDALHGLGVTRLSVGLQTLSEKGLQILERKSTRTMMEQAGDILENKWRGRSLSYDLMIGWPGQTVREFQSMDLEFLRRCRFEHISLYILNYERGTRLERNRKRSLVQPLDEDISANIWECWLDAATTLGLVHYEISNFSKEGHKSLHNRNTWRGLPYLGLGCGAVSRVGRVRWTNPATPELYLKKIAQGRPPAVAAEYLTPTLSWQEDLFLSMRFEEGLDATAFKHMHGVNPQHVLGDKLSVWREQGWLKADALAFTSKGWTLFDALVSDWMLLIEKNSLGA